MNLKTLHKLSYGVYVICSKDNSKKNGQIANAVIQVTAEPQTVAVSINKQNLTHVFIEKSGFFTVSVLSEDAPMKFIGTFGFKSGRDVDKFKNVKSKTGKTGSPIVLDYSIAYFEAEVINKIDVGTHTIFIGKVVDADILSNDRPMTYEYYHKVKGGYSPKTAPTYSSVVDTPESTEKQMDKYVCTICGYIYDPKNGDPDNGIKPGTSFEKLPKNWVCPICGAGKDAFNKV